MGAGEVGDDWQCNRSKWFIKRGEIALRSEWWNVVVKDAVEKKEAGWKDELGTSNKSVK